MQPKEVQMVCHSFKVSGSRGLRIRSLAGPGKSESIKRASATKVSKAVAIAIRLLQLFFKIY